MSIKYWNHWGPLENVNEEGKNLKLELVAESVPLADFYRHLSLLQLELATIVVVEGASDDIRTLEIYRRVA